MEANISEYEVALEIRYSTFHFYEITHIVHVTFLHGVEGLNFIDFIPKRNHNMWHGRRNSEKEEFAFFK